MVVTICLVATYDVYCTINLAGTLKDFEQNPVAKMMIDFENEIIFSVTNHPNGNQISTKIPINKTNVATLVGYKVIGLLLVYTYFIFSYVRQPRIAYVTVTFMFFFQLLLLGKLVL